VSKHGPQNSLLLNKHSLFRSDISLSSSIRKFASNARRSATTLRLSDGGSRHCAATIRGSVVDPKRKEISPEFPKSVPPSKNENRALAYFMGAYGAD
jgi:hypothetical protein